MQDKLDLLLQQTYDLNVLLQSVVETRNPIDYVRQISQLMPFPIDYRNRKHLYALSPNAQVVVTAEDYGSITLTSGIWTLLDFPEGTRIFAPSIPSNAPVYIALKATDELINNYPVNVNAFLTNAAITATPSTGNASFVSGAGNTVIKGSSGNLISIVINTAGTTGFQVFDNATTNAGTVLYTSKAAPAVGDIYLIDGFAFNGITLANTATGPAGTVYYI